MKAWNEFYKEWTVKDYKQHIRAWSGFCNRVAAYTPKNELILEVGFGTGQMSIYLSKLGYNVFALDKSRVQKERADRLARELKVSPHFMNVDIFKLIHRKEEFRRFWKNQFHTVFSQGFLEHFSDNDIKRLFDIQFAMGKVVAFSVPLDKFGHQSRGDERLLSKEYWRKLVAKYKILHWSTFAGNNGQLAAVLTR